MKMGLLKCMLEGCIHELNFKYLLIQLDLNNVPMGYTPGDPSYMHPIVSASSKVECINELHMGSALIDHPIVSVSSKVECVNELATWEIQQVTILRTSYSISASRQYSKVKYIKELSEFDSNSKNCRVMGIFDYVVCIAVASFAVLVQPAVLPREPTPPSPSPTLVKSC